jgi:hypothetical protein
MISQDHVFLALEAHRSGRDGSFLEELGMETLMKYAAEQLLELHGHYDEHSVLRFVKRLAHDHAIERAVFEGILEEELDGTLSLTAEGEAMCDDFLESNGFEL